MEMKEKLRPIKIFKNTSDSDLFEIAKICKSRQYVKDEIIFEENSEGKELYFIYEGSVKLEVAQYDSRNFHQFCTIPFNEVVGDLSFIDNHHRSSRAVANDDMEILYIDRDSLYKCLESHPSMGYHFMKNLAVLIAKRLRLTNNIVRSSLDLS